MADKIQGALTLDRDEPWWRQLGAQVLVAIAIGVAVGFLFPRFGVDLKILGDIFLRLIKTVVAPLVFFSVVLGIIAAGDIRRAGRVGVISIIYFEIVTTIALAVGLVLAHLFGIGRGVGAVATAPSAGAAAHPPTVTTFILNIFPDNFVGAFTRSELLQVLVISVILGAAMLRLPPARRTPIESGLKYISAVFFEFIDIVMKFAPIGALGAVAFAVASSGSGVIWALAYLVLVYWLTIGLFMVTVFGTILYLNGVNIFRLFRYLREEVFIVLGTGSSESVLPRLLEKLERLGCSKQTVGLVLPLGYAFNLDGTAIYMPMGIIFIANAYGIHLSLEQQLGICALLLVTSKGAATVSGGTFVVFAATITAIDVLPLSGLPLLFGVFRLQSSATALCNIFGNCVATIVTARYSREFNQETARLELSGKV